MQNDKHYDVIIIGSCAGGGTLAWKLAPTGKKILLIERVDFYTKVLTFEKVSESEEYQPDLEFHRPLKVSLTKL